MRILIPLLSPATGTWGGLTRALAITRAAEQAGHDIAFCAAGDVKVALERHGYPVYPIPAATMLGLPKPISRILEKRSQRTSIPIKPGKSFGSMWLVYMFSGYGDARYLRHLVTAEINIAEQFQADRIFTDMDPGAFLLAAILGLPTIATYATIAEEGAGTFAWRRMQQAFSKVLKHYGKPAMTPHELLFNPCILKIIPSIPELDEANPARPDVRYVGSLIGDIQPKSDFQPEPGRRYVFVYTGTGSMSLTTLETVLPEVFPADGSTTCLVGSQSIEKPLKRGGVEFRPYIPAASVLPSCDWVICHGGQNTIIQSLQNDVPLIIFPGPVFERRYNARKVAEAGAGVMAEIPDFTPEKLQQMLSRQADCAHHAARLGECIRSYGGAQAAIQAIANWTERVVS